MLVFTHTHARTHARTHAHRTCLFPPIENQLMKKDLNRPQLYTKGDLPTTTQPHTEILPSLLPTKHHNTVSTQYSYIIVSYDHAVIYTFTLTIAPIETSASTDETETPFKSRRPQTVAPLSGEVTVAHDFFQFKLSGV